MFIVGLTGNIAAGKSSVAALFAQWGAVVTDADAIVRDLQRPGTPVFQTIVSRFGEEIVSEDGTLDRQALRSMVLDNPQGLRDLNALIHPAVAARRQALESAAQNAGTTLIVHDIPLLFEATDTTTFDLIVLVDAPEPVRRDRLMRYRKLDRAEADRLMATQWSSDQKREASDIVIDNDGDRGRLEARARDAWARILEAATDA